MVGSPAYHYATEAEIRSLLDETLEEICATSAITDPGIRTYLAAKLGTLWQEGTRTKAALVAAVSPARKQPAGAAS